MHKVERAIIMAAGLGKRMQPVTLTTPKPLIIVNGVRLIDPVVAALHKNKIYEKSLKLLLKDDIDNIIINSPDEKNYILDILKNYNLHEDILKIYDGDLNIFEEYELETQIEKALHNKDFVLKYKYSLK